MAGIKQKGKPSVSRGVRLRVTPVLIPFTAPSVAHTRAESEFIYV